MTYWGEESVSGKVHMRDDQLTYVQPSVLVVTVTGMTSNSVKTVVS